MVKIILENIGKKFDRQWALRSINKTFEANEKWAITGKNGSGKSTLLQIISGALIPGEGTITHLINDKKIDTEKIYSYVSLATPYTDLIEELTLAELIKFHNQFKPFYNTVTCAEALKITQLEKHQYKPVKSFSSGMKQRVKLMLAILSDTPLLLLDEPASNLDNEGIEWYNNLINNYKNNRTIIVFSNSRKAEEYNFCSNIFELST